MSKAVKNIHTIYNNPFVLSPLLANFYKNYNGQDNDILLSYLIFPLVLHSVTKDWLKKASTRSSLLSFGRQKENFFGLPQRIQEYKTITNKCLQHLIDNKHLKINDGLSVEVIKPDGACVNSLKESFTASANIVKIFKEYDVISIYKLLGVKQL